MITAIVMGILVGVYGDRIEAKARSYKDSQGAVLAAFVLLGMAVALVVTTAEWVF